MTVFTGDYTNDFGALSDLVDFYVEAGDLSPLLPILTGYLSGPLASPGMVSPPSFIMDEFAQWNRTIDPMYRGFIEDLRGLPNFTPTADAISRETYGDLPGETQEYFANRGIDMSSDIQSSLQGEIGEQLDRSLQQNAVRGGKLELEKLTNAMGALGSPTAGYAQRGQSAYTFANQANQQNTEHYNSLLSILQEMMQTSATPYDDPTDQIFSIVGAILGGVAGGYFGGPVGAGAGASIGNSLGGLLGSSVEDDQDVVFEW